MLIDVPFNDSGIAFDTDEFAVDYELSGNQRHNRHHFLKDHAVHLS